RAHYHDCIRRIDQIVGETVAKLEEDGLLEDTFIFYFGDHGGVMPRGKGYIYESGLNVPLVIRVPENWKHLVNLDRGATQNGFVSFVDFPPTVLALAGLEVPEAMDGKPFLGKSVDAAEVATRDRAFGHADRFDEKYDLVRTLRIGDWKYMRSYQPHYPDGLQNNYRYFMLAYREWRSLYREGKLGSNQRLFFEPKPAEQLFHIPSDRHEVNNRADEPDQAERLAEMRAALTTHLKSINDLGFIPEDTLHDEAMENPVAYGEANSARIAAAIDTADLMLLPFGEAAEPLREAIASEDPLIRQWAATVAAAFGEEATDLAADVRPLLKDEDPIVRLRAVEFLGQTGAVDPRAPIAAIVNGTEHPVTQMIALNTAAWFHAHPELAFPFDPASFTAVDESSEPYRRIQYFADDWIKKRPKKKKK
ncbi:MAG: sulfatase-like hydrolase/transferase, partial [Verrucomicrobiota bacterium]